MKFIKRRKAAAAVKSSAADRSEKLFNRVGAATKKNTKAGDIPLLVCVFVMACFGCLMIYSASSYTAEVQYGDSLYFVKKQLLGVGLGTAAMIGMCFLPYKKLMKCRYPAIIIAAILLCLVFVPVIGITNYGATRWIGFGGFTIQPSEIAKYAFALFAAAYFAKNHEKVKTVKGVLPVLGVGIGFCVLIIVEPNMSITMCVGLLMLSLVFLSGTNLKTFLFLLIPFAVAIPVLIILEPYRLQ
ncbi:MAG: FtsW/RodA/SpoVE family cell cycle protein, partial [Clostridia bacterium]|nr:FtsW/RodA/SpoVE family cell cycle protein [Clostridia bacterium]